jgi:hypothetical protein
VPGAAIGAKFRLTSIGTVIMDYVSQCQNFDPRYHFLNLTERLFKKRSRPPIHTTNWSQNCSVLLEDKAWFGSKAECPNRGWKPLPLRSIVEGIFQGLSRNNLWERHLAANFEHFEPVHNAVIGQEMIVLKPV